MTISETIANIIYLPRNFDSIGNVSVYSLLQNSGYFEMYDLVTEDAIREMLLTQPERMDEWMLFSEGKRVSSGWFIKKGAKGYQIGYFPANNICDQPINYLDKAAACAAFIKREIEDIRIKGKQS